VADDERYYKRVWVIATTRYSVRATWCAADRLVKCPTALVLAACVCALGCASVAAAPQPRESSAAVHAITGFDPRWIAALTTPLLVRVVFDEEHAYAATADGQLVALGLDDGQARWRVETPVRFAPATGDGLVFVPGEGTIVALEQRSGTHIWRVAAGGRLADAVYFESGFVFASTETGELLAIRAHDGEVRWRVASGTPLAAAPVSLADTFYVALRDGRVLALARDAGEVLWTLPIGEPVTGLLSLEEQLLVGTAANRLHSVSLRGRLRWSQKAGGDVAGAPVADDRHIYFAAHDNVLRALHRRTGSVQWRRPLPSRPSGGVVLTDHLALVAFTTHTIGAYLSSTGAEAFTVHGIPEIGGTAFEINGTPFLRDAARTTAPRLFAVSRRGALQAFALRVEPALAALEALPGVRVGSE
jgi:outer membrane protein assembly factor BamB